MQPGAPDIMTFLYQRFLEWREPTVQAHLKMKQEMAAKGMEISELAKPTLEDFISFGRDYFIRNPPQGTSYLTVGLGVRLANGATLAFMPQDGSGYQMRDEGVPITRPQSIPGMEGVIPSHSVPIFSGR